MAERTVNEFPPGTRPQHLIKHLPPTIHSTNSPHSEPHLRPRPKRNNQHHTRSTTPILLPDITHHATQQNPLHRRRPQAPLPTAQANPRQLHSQGADHGRRHEPQASCLVCPCLSFPPLSSHSRHRVFFLDTSTTDTKPTTAAGATAP